MTDINVYFNGLLWSINDLYFLDKIFASLADRSASCSGIKHENMSDQQSAEEFHKKLLETLREEKDTHLL